jgi:PAS domain S-box-containing protein
VLPGTRRQARAAGLPAPLDLAVFRQMADMSNDAFYLCNADGRFLYVNDRAMKLGDYTREDLLAMTVPDLNPEFPPDRFRDYVAALEAGSAPAVFETIARCKDGRIIPTEIAVSLLHMGGATYLFGVVRDISERRHMEAVHRSFAQRVLQTLEAERERVARELHDDVGQALATIGVLLHALERTPGSVPQEARPALAATHATIAQITESVGRIVRDYHPTELLGSGLRESIRAHARQFAERHRLRLRMATAAVAGLLEPDHELHVYRIVQEALANVARHAQARSVTVRIARRDAHVVVSVRDDGKGFAAGRPRSTGLGLVTMRERAQLMRAELAVRSTPRRGTTVRVAVPIRAAAEAAP